MNTAVLNRRIDPSAPMADASALLMAASTAAAAPVVPPSTSRHARRFRRDNTASPRGATSMFRRRLTPTFSTAKAPVMTRTNLRMASALLMSTPAETGRISRLTPRVSVLSMTEMRAQVRAIRAQRQKAMLLTGTLRARFMGNAADWGVDHRFDTPRMLGAKARFAGAQGPSPRFDY